MNLHLSSNLLSSCSASVHRLSHHDFIPHLLALSSFLSYFFGQENRMDVREDTTLGDCNALQQLVQLLVVADSELNVARGDSLFLVVSCSIARELQNFCAQVLRDTRQVPRTSSAFHFIDTKVF